MNGKIAELISAQSIDASAPAYAFNVKLIKSGKYIQDNQGQIANFTMQEAALEVERLNGASDTERPDGNDILQYRWKFQEVRGKTIYIVCPGKNGRDHYDAIPHRAFTICVNKGIECVKFPDLWMIADSECPKADWWAPAYKQHKDKLCLIEDFPGLKSKWYFKRGDQLKPDDVTIIDGIIRTGASIGACAIQLAYQLGASKIVLVGMDMEGCEYYDGTESSYTRRRDQVWNTINRVNALVLYLYDQGVRIESTSATAIEIACKPKGRPILHAGDFLKGDVYIVGTGPNGRKHYNEIPHDAKVIVVNAAINVMGIPKMLWMCEDSTLPTQTWFQDAVARKGYTDELDNRYCPTLVFADKKEMNRFGTPFYFTNDGFIKGRGNPHGKIIMGKTFGGGTIACRAMQIAIQLGATRIILCGIDMHGSVYFDETKVAAQFKALRDNKDWEVKDSMQTMIDFAWNEHGVKTVSLSPTALNVEVCRPAPLSDPIQYVLSREEYPSVAYLSMSFMPWQRMNIIAWCMAQDYPDKLKTLYMVNQPPFPKPILHDLPIKIREINVDAAWPAAWAMKLWAFLAEATEDIMMIFDQDDCWMPSYTKNAIVPIVTKKGDFAWCHTMRFIENVYIKDGVEVVVPNDQKVPAGGEWRASIKTKRHQSAIGTLVARTAALREAADILKQRYPTGLVKSSGPIDNYLRRLLQNEFGDRLTSHEAEGRWYYLHTKASSKFGRRSEQYVDHCF